ncbi:T9SS type B sorting domain-containing protein [Flavobacterium granuli]|uniref:Gliding motility-associated C-terminal domain-containing protein n=1 Tax=Flavobacterium granuli TaxID=280093 RepID=A0A1M5LIW0_9FLAO|nr:choice-of-anchor L domain-containing protein [Flavobacterium granuli]PRZ23993.1 gliding motility-associated-like protein [Flavobacterium granuli]SHG64860.1 gliding motility-associated C-terminal domain-containing protein [Flavobacterium granuli]
MKCIKIILFWILVLCNTTLVFAQAIRVDDSKNATDLTQILTNNSSCINISGESVKGDEFTSGQESYGYFNNQGGSFPFTEGIVLSTWSSKNSEGPFIRNQGAGNSLWKGDADLDQALGINSINATVLEFDFIPLTNFISFNYLFASNEYQDDYPCNYSDGFAFLIKEENAANYRNLALIPRSTTPVSSTTIHPPISYTNNFGNTTSCPAENETYFDQLNTSLTNSSPINYAGQTKILNAQTTVIPGKKYHIKLVIADQDNFRYDSAVFIEAGSFTSKIDLGSDRTTQNNPICFGEKFIIDTKLSPAYTYRWYKDDSLTPISGETNPSYEATETGIYRVEVELGSASCIASGQIKIEFTPEIVLQDTNLIQCDDNGDEIAFFDLTRAEPILKNNNSNLGNMVFYENVIDAQSNQNPIQNPKNYTNKANNQIIIAKVSDNYGCANYAQLTLQISNQTITPLAPIVVCDDNDGNSDGIHQFDLMAIATSGYFSAIGSNVFVYFYLNPTDAYLEKNELPYFFKNTISGGQTLYARVLNGPDCYAITPVILVVNTFNPLNFEDETIALCEGRTLDLTVSNIYSSYLWNTGATSNSISVSSPGDYSVIVTDANGCGATKKFQVLNSGIATITGTKINDFAANQNSVLIEYTGLGDYEFSIDGSYFQDSPLFNGIAAGTYWAYARDKNGCGDAAPFQFYVLDYPRFFTPNGDGFNDLWIIKNLDLFPKATVTIFDRYGKLLKQLHSSNAAWDGTFNGYNLPSDDYWFNIIFTNNKSIKGHFSLKR